VRIHRHKASHTPMFLINSRFFQITATKPKHNP
jgi:hypothetical protein